MNRYGGHFEQVNCLKELCKYENLVEGQGFAAFLEDGQTGTRYIYVFVRNDHGQTFSGKEGLLEVGKDFNNFEWWLHKHFRTETERLAYDIQAHEGVSEEEAWERAKRRIAEENILPRALVVPQQDRDDSDLPW